MFTMSADALTTPLPVIEIVGRSSFDMALAGCHAARAMRKMVSAAIHFMAFFKRTLRVNLNRNLAVNSVAIAAICSGIWISLADGLQLSSRCGTGEQGARSSTG